MLERTSTLVISTDMQVKLASVMHNSATICRNAGTMIEACQKLDIPVLWLEQYPKGLGQTLPEIAQLLKGQSPHIKTTFSSLRDPVVADSFESYNRNQVLLIGIETHVCIYQTAMDLIGRGVETHVVADAVSSRTKENRDIGISKIVRAGGHVTSVETALFELLKTSDDVHFKKIMALIK